MEDILPAPTTILEDRRLVDRIRTGDEEAFAALFHRFRNDVYRTARAITGDHEDSLDVVQETFLKVYRRIAGWNGAAALRTWVVRIAIHTAIDCTRKARRHPDGARAAEPAHDPRASLDRELLVARLRNLVGRLRGSQALVLRLRLFDGRSNREIAELLEITEGNVRMQLTKALRRLKEML